MKPRIYELVTRCRHPYPWRVVDDVGSSYDRHVIEESARSMQLENPERQYAIATIGDDGECFRIDQCDRTCQICGATETMTRFNRCPECSGYQD